MTLHFNPDGIRDVAALIDQPVELLPQLANDSVAPDPGMYGKILIFSAQQTEPMATEARRHLLGGMHAAGASISQGLRATADDYERTEQQAVDIIKSLPSDETEE